MSFRLPKLDKTMPIVEFRMKDPRTGQWTEAKGLVTPEFQRWWQQSVIKSDKGANALGEAGAGFYTAPVISNPPSQSQVQAIANALEAMSDFLTGN